MRRLARFFENGLTNNWLKQLLLLLTVFLIDEKIKAKLLSIVFD